LSVFYSFGANIWKFQSVPKGVHAPGSVHDGPSAQPPSDKKFDKFSDQFQVIQGGGGPVPPFLITLILF
jgi:hypothetical protein